MRWLPIIAGLGILAALWGEPLRAASAHSFAAHMAIHMGVVALVAPLIASGIAGTRYDPSPRHPILFGPLPTSLFELIIVWAWHVPVLHGAARSNGWLFAVEQGSFLAAGLLVWIACLGFAAGAQGRRSLAGTIGLLLTSIHMTLLGALLAFAGRPLYAHAGHGEPAVQIADQQLGGIIMLFIGGAVYLGGGLYLMARVLLTEERPA